MHRRSLKLKVVAALFSAAFLLGAVDARASSSSYGDLIVTKNLHLQIDYGGFFDTVTVSNTGSLIVTQNTINVNGAVTVMGISYLTVKDGGTIIADTITTEKGSQVRVMNGALRVNYIANTNFSKIYAEAGGEIIANTITNDSGMYAEAGGKITANTITNDSVIRAYDGGTITINKIIDNNNLMEATNGGVITADSIIDLKQTGDITSDGIVKAGGKVTAGSFKVGVVNASTVTATKNQYIGGKYSITKQVKLNGGATLNKQKITKVAKGTISATSTEVVNGAQLYSVSVKAKSGGYINSGDTSVSTADGQLSVNKTGKIEKGNTDVVTGGTAYTATDAVQTSLNKISTTTSKNQVSLAMLQDNMADLKKSVASINSAVANTTKNLSSSFSNLLQADLGNLSDDGKSVIRNLITETLRGMNVSSASIVSNNEASLNTASISPVSIMPAAVDAVETTNITATSVTSADIDNVYDALDGKASKTDFETMKANVDSNATTIATNTENIKTNAAAIDTLKTSKANTDGSNLDVDAYSAKLGTGKIEKDNTGLINGGAVYGALDQKVDKSYVDAGLGVMGKQLDSVKQTTTRDMNRMGANAAALASLHPQDYNSADKLDFAAGYGHYHNSNATAVGAFYRPNASTMVSLASTVGNGDSMVSAGLSFKLGMNANVEKVMISKDDFDKQQAVNHQMKGRLDNQTARLQQMEAALSVMISH